MMFLQKAIARSLLREVPWPALTPVHQLMCLPTANELVVPTDGKARLQIQHDHSRCARFMAGKDRQLVAEYRQKVHCNYHDLLWSSPNHSTLLPVMQSLLHITLVYATTHMSLPISDDQGGSACVQSLDMHCDRYATLRLGHRPRFKSSRNTRDRRHHIATSQQKSLL